MSAPENTENENGLPAPHDPTKDVNGKLLSAWLLGSIVGVFVAVWLLGFAYDFFLQKTKSAVIETSPTEARDALEQQEMEFMKAGGSRKVSLEEAERRYLEK